MRWGRMSKDLAERIIREQVDTILDDIDYGRMTYAEFIADPTSYLNPHIMRGYARVWQWQRAIYNRVVRQVDPTKQDMDRYIEEQYAKTYFTYSGWEAFAY